MKECKQCQSLFEITDWDRNFYKKMDVPEPTFCYPCRSQRRMVNANQFNLYKRKCDATGDDIISAYHPDSPLKVYRQSVWSDLSKFDATQYGRDFDFTRPFFDQFHELANAVPRPALHTMFQMDENSDYTNYAGYNKNCYMLFDSDYDWDCYYSMGVNKSRNCIDNYRLKECELCYECVDCVKSYALYYSQDCDNCSNSAFLKNCIGVKNSFMCSNLKNKEYYIYNKPYDKETFEKLMTNLSRHSELQKYLATWNTLKTQYPQRYMHGVQNENVTGDYIVYSKNAEQCFDSMDLWDSRYVTRSFGSVKDAMDCDEIGEAELFYETAFSGYNVKNFRFSMLCFNQESDLDYSFYCNFSSDCFGSVGLNRKKFCILNKQYNEADYKALKSKIIDHMKSTGEWGEFFPAKYSDFAYNETVAQEYFPMKKEDVLARGLRWREKDKQEYKSPTAQIPDDSIQASENIVDEFFACEDCSRNYKIIKQEFSFYKNQGISLPKKCFYCRHTSRFALRNTRILFDRSCASCGLSIKTTYKIDRLEKIYCENCYQQSLV